MGRQEKDGSGFSEFVSTFMFSDVFPQTAYHSGNVTSVARDGHYTDAPVISGIKAARVYLELARRYST